MSQLTGLSAPIISLARTCASIRAASGGNYSATGDQIIGRIDLRYLGTEPGPGRRYEPTMIRRGARSPAASVGALNDYLMRDLGYRTPLTYRPNNYAEHAGAARELRATNHRMGQQPLADTSRRSGGMRCVKTRE